PGLLLLRLQLEVRLLSSERAELVPQVRLLLRDLGRQGLDLPPERRQAPRELGNGVGQGGSRDRANRDDQGDARRPAELGAANTAGSRIVQHSRPLVSPRYCLSMCQ